MVDYAPPMLVSLYFTIFTVRLLEPLCEVQVQLLLACYK